MDFVYANAVGARGGAFDISLEFGYVVPPGEGEAPPVPNWRVRVAMSWEHARAMLQLLEEQIQAYEDKVGPIPDIERLREGAR
jgi:hypothetical protein